MIGTIAKKFGKPAGSTLLVLGLSTVLFGGSIATAGPATTSKTTVASSDNVLPAASLRDGLPTNVDLPIAGLSVANPETATVNEKALDVEPKVIDYVELDSNVHISKSVFEGRTVTYVQAFNGNEFVDCTSNCPQIRTVRDRRTGKVSYHLVINRTSTVVDSNRAYGTQPQTAQQAYISTAWNTKAPAPARETVTAFGATFAVPMSHLFASLSDSSRPAASVPVYECEDPNGCYYGGKG